MTAVPVEAFEPGKPVPLPEDVLQRVNAHAPRFAEGIRSALRRAARLGGDFTIHETGVLRGHSLAPFCDGRAWWCTGGRSSGSREVLLGVAPGLVYSALDRKLGGSGRCDPPERAPSPLEEELGREVLEQLFTGAVQGLSSNPLRLSIECHGLVREPLGTHLPQLDTPFVCMNLVVKLFEQPHEILLCLRREMLEEHLRQTAPPARRPAAAKPALSPAMRRAVVQLEAVLARCRLTLQEVRQLEVGDVILFDERAGQDLVVEVEGRPKFEGRLGSHDDFYAVEVLRTLDAAAERNTTEPPAEAEAPTPPPPQAPVAAATAPDPAPQPAPARPPRKDPAPARPQAAKGPNHGRR